MATHAFTKDTREELLELQRGLHLAMSNLVETKNYAEAERVLHMVDYRISELIRTAAVVR